MPYKHPDLGVECMTLGEFWSSEAKQAGVEPAELMSDFYDDIRAEEELEIVRIKNNTTEALSALQDYYHPNYFLPDKPPFEVKEVIKIVEANCSFSYKCSTTTFIALVKCSDKNRHLRHTTSHYAGSYMEPPDYDVECEEVIF